MQYIGEATARIYRAGTRRYGVMVDGTDIVVVADNPVKAIREARELLLEASLRRGKATWECVTGPDRLALPTPYEHKDALPPIWSYAYFQKEFEKRVCRTTCCWLWLGKRDEHGYGKERIDRHWISAHRFSWSMYHQQHVPAGMVICHRCDVRPCANPDHLFAGYVEDNWIDMVMKGRYGKGYAEIVNGMRRDGYQVPYSVQQFCTCHDLMLVPAEDRTHETAGADLVRAEGGGGLPYGGDLAGDMLPGRHEHQIVAAPSGGVQVRGLVGGAGGADQDFWDRFLLERDQSW